MTHANLIIDYILLCSQPPVVPKEQRHIFKVEQSHAVFPEFSSKIVVESDVKVGRFIVAKDTILPNETILSEEAFAR